MKYSCEVIQDLLPLYYDGICSMESRHIVEEHMRECMHCKKVYEELSVDSPERPQTDFYQERNTDSLRADSLRKVKKVIIRKQMISAMVAVFILALFVFISVRTLKGSIQKIDNTKNISVLMVDGNIVGRLSGSKWSNAALKRVEADGNNYIFFSLTDTKWDRLITSSEIYSEYMICGKDKGADSIDAVYYYSGDYGGLEERDIRDLTGQSVLLWEK